MLRDEGVGRKRQGTERYLPGLPSLWSLSLGDPKVCIAVLDGPVDFGHPCFDGALLKQVKILDSVGDSEGMTLRHGTHVASLVFGQHESPVRGIASGCRGAVIPVFRERGDGSIVPCSQLDLARAVSMAVSVGANVINISGGRYDPTGQPEPVLMRAIELCARQGILVVASAGNDGCACPHVPGAAESVLVVGAMNAEGEPTEFSNWAQAYHGHGVLAPGDSIEGAAPDGGTAVYSGTSFATPFVSGVAALLMSIQMKTGRPADAQAVRRAILESAVGCDQQPTADCRRLLAGRLNVSGALSLVTQGEYSEMSERENQTVPTSCERQRNDFDEEEADETTAGGDQSSPPVQQGQPSAVEEPGSGSNRGQKKPVGKSTCPGTEPTLVYVLGLIDFDFGTEARRDAFIQRGVANPNDPGQLLPHLEANPWDAIGLTWILVQEATPVYAVQPAGPFAGEVYKRLAQFLREQGEEGVSQISIPGYVAGSTSLMNGQEVPVVVPDIRGMCSWSTPALVEAVLGQRPEDPEEQAAYDVQAGEVGGFLDRVYFELSNVGVSPQERAINYAATNAYQAAAVFQDAIKEKLKLDRIDIERSTVCRPGSDCWDVKLTFFDPVQRHERAREVYRFTIDVSEVIPVTVGKLRSWSAY